MMITKIMVTFGCDPCDIRIVMVARELTAYSYQEQFKSDHRDCAHDA